MRIVAGIGLPGEVIQRLMEQCWTAVIVNNTAIPVALVTGFAPCTFAVYDPTGFLNTPEGKGVVRETARKSIDPALLGMFLDAAIGR